MQKTTLGIMIAGLLGATPVLAETIDLMVLRGCMALAAALA